MSNNYILLWFSASDNLNSLLHAYECDHGFMPINVIEELQEVDGKSPPSIGECYEYNHSKRKDFILWYTIIANTVDKAQCMIDVKLHEHYHNGFLWPAFPKLVKGLADFHPL
jgi:hypothetical protein